MYCFFLGLGNNNFTDIQPDLPFWQNPWKTRLLVILIDLLLIFIAVV